MDDILAQYFTEPELAKQLGRKLSTLARWRKLGIGPPVTLIGKKTPIYRRESVQVWLAAQERATPSPRQKSDQVRS